MLPDIQPGNTKILYFFNCLLDGMHTKSSIFDIFYCGMRKKGATKIARQSLYLLTVVSYLHYSNKKELHYTD